MITLENLEKKDTRSAFGAALLEVGKRNADVVALTADLTGSVKMDAFAKEFPERFFQVGIAEANMIGMAAGLTLSGKIPFTGTFAAFSTGRVYDQIRQSVAYSEKNVKIYASHAGLTVGEDGATHQILEDMGLMKMLPGMTVIHPCDYNQAYQATLAVAAHKGPVYLRCGRPEVPNFTPKDKLFEIGKANLLQEGTDVSIIAIGHLVFPALQAALILKEKGISAEVLDMATLKPLDTEAVLQTALKTRCIVTAEEHQIYGGLGDSIANCLSRSVPTPIEMIGVHDRFGQSGTPAELMDAYGLNAQGIVDGVLRVIPRRNG